jgi:hypothetical protein
VTFHRVRRIGGGLGLLCVIDPNEDAS